MLDEASIIYECKTCHNMFRSLANLIAHKRSYCCHQYLKIQHVYSEKIGKDFSSSQTIFIESEPLDMVLPEDVWDADQFSESLHEFAVQKEIEVKPVVNRLLPSKKEGLQSVLDRLANRTKPSASEHAVLLEPLSENKNAVFQNLLEIRTIGQEYIEQNNETTETILVGRDGQEMPRDMMDEPAILRADSPAGSDNSKENDVRERKQKTIYPCPLCKQDFSKVNTVYKHLGRIHGKTEAEAKKMRKKIRAGSKLVIKKSEKRHKEKSFEAKESVMRVQKVSDGRQQQQPASEEEAIAGEQSATAAEGPPQQRPVYEVCKALMGEAPLRFAMHLGLVSRAGVGMQKVNRLNEVWETKEDQAKKTKSRLERRLARKKEGLELEGNTDDDDEDTEISFNMERLSPQGSAAKKARLATTSSYLHGAFNCHICQKSFKTPTFLYQHYTSSHFQNEIRADFSDDIKKRRCSLCGATFEVPLRLVVHLGATHKVIQRYMPADQVALAPFSQRGSKLIGRPPPIPANHDAEPAAAAAAATVSAQPDVSCLPENPPYIKDEFV